MKRPELFRVVLLLLLFSVIGFLVMGYHPGAEDDGIYLAAIKSRLNPALYPHDAAFFQLQMRTSVFDTWMAHFIHGTGMPVPWAALFWQTISILLFVSACYSIISVLFKEAAARWAGIALTAAMFTLPVSGTALYILDQHLHPRNPAAALILLSISRILAGKRWQAIPAILVAFLLHPLMGAFGVIFCSVLALTLDEAVHILLGSVAARLRANPVTVTAMIPFAWLLSPPSRSWIDAARTGHIYHQYQLYQWAWYEWLGVIGPFVIFWVVARIARKRGEMALFRFAWAILIYGVFMQLLSMAILFPGVSISFSTLEPMRYLQLVYVFLVLIGGAYLGKYLLKAHRWRWVIFLLAANCGMFVAQRQLFAATPHIELPSAASANPWLQSFDWIRHNTPQDAYFVLDPNYVAAPGDDYHGFRALAERSALADIIKDTGAVTKSPELGPEWSREIQAEGCQAGSRACPGWRRFELADFERLKTEFGVNWVLVSYPPPAGLACEWHNGTLSVCRIP
ncbi:MAG: hypothetical protein ABSB60_15340 [Terracidiphilus sp.]